QDAAGKKNGGLGPQADFEKFGEAGQAAGSRGKASSEQARQAAQKEAAQKPDAPARGGVAGIQRQIGLELAELQVLGIALALQGLEHGLIRRGGAEGAVLEI